jgi:periplasmic protein TonB
VPAYAEHRSLGRPRERAYALAAVVCVQLALGFALLTGLRVPLARSVDVAQRLLNFTLPPPPPRPPTRVREMKRSRNTSSAPKAEPAPLGGSPGARPAHAPPSVTPIVAVKPTLAPSGGGTGAGPAVGSGAGGGAGGNGSGSGGGGHDLELLSGDITPRDYPKRLARAGIGGTVGMRGTVGANGRVTNCRIIRSSGVPELDAVTCRLIEQRFVYRPATDRQGRPVPDDVEIEWTWD